MSTDPKAPFHNPFGQLMGLKDRLPEGPKKKTETAAPPSFPKAVVRLERTGRSGKEVTVVEQLPLDKKEQTRWLKELKHALGCGGSLEEGRLVLQGDHRERLPSLLQARGVQRISVG